MKLAYLILAHEHPGQLARLARRLCSARSIVFIHVDAKVEIAPFREALRDLPGVHWIEDRVRVEWMGFSIVEAALRLVRAALREDFGYAIFLSGADYPLKTPHELAGFYERSDREFISFWHLADRPSWMHKIQYFYFIDAIPIRGWSKHCEPLWWRRFFWGRFFKYQHLLPKRRFIEGMVPCGGPDWWSLSRACLEYVAGYVDTHPAFTRFYRRTASPGEMFFQTLVLNSPFREKVLSCDAYSAWAVRVRPSERTEDSPMLPEEEANLRYVDWSGVATAEREGPAILDDRDWPRLRSTKCHFARKLHPQRSASLMDRIDRELLRAVEAGAIPHVPENPLP